MTPEETVRQDRSSNVITTVKYGSIHRSKNDSYRYKGQEFWRSILYRATYFLLSTRMPLLYIGITSSPSMQLPPALCSFPCIRTKTHAPYGDSYWWQHRGAVVPLCIEDIVLHGFLCDGIKKKKLRIIQLNERFWAFTCRRRGSNPYSVSRKGF